MAKKITPFADIADTPVNMTPQGHSKRVLKAGKELGNFRQKRSMEEGVDIARTVRAKAKKK